jgi:hypothetical protein
VLHGGFRLRQVPAPARPPSPPPRNAADERVTWNDVEGDGAGDDAARVALEDTRSADSCKYK